MKYSFHPAAKQELFNTIEYYESCRNGLGIEFLIEFQKVIQRILHFPNAWGRLSKNTRRCLTNRFPYGIIYQILKNEIIIIAVMQLNRKPKYWKNRIK
ncbi:plasmid stabilization system protein [bacterium BMS3Abin03]|nr:plasmid stabilization system protein [bacterium BMS3Abin03]